MIRFKKNIICGITLAISDLIGIVVSMYAALWLISIMLPHFEQRVPLDQIIPWSRLHWLLSLCCVIWFGIRLRHYLYRKTYWLELKEIFRTLIIFAVIELAVMAFAKWYFSRYLWLLTWVFAGILVPFLRIGIKKILDLFGIWMRETWIIGSGNNAIEAYSAIKSEKNLGLKVVRFIAFNKIETTANTIENIPVSYLDEEQLKNVDHDVQFIIAVESHESNIRNEWLRKFMIHGYRFVSVIPTLRGMPLDNTDMAFIFSHEIMIFRVQQNLAKLSSQIIKRIFDIIVSLSIIVILSPLLIYISLKVKKDGGNAIYGHERVGKGGETFKCLKFRSMVINSQDVLDNLLKNNSQAKAEWDLTFKLKNDPRITNIGKFLRKTSLDELPQLFNVLKGEMSLVGPRPVIKAELERYNQDVEYYLLSKPGMTGLWQVSGRNDVSYETRVYLDAWYVKNWSMWNDIAILFKTIYVVLKKDGAY